MKKHWINPNCQNSQPTKGTVGISASVSMNMISNKCIIYHRKQHMISYNLSQKKFQSPKFLFGTFWTQIEQTSHCDLGILKSFLFQDVPYFMNNFCLDFLK